MRRLPRAWIAGGLLAVGCAASPSDALPPDSQAPLAAPQGTEAGASATPPAPEFPDPAFRFPTPHRYAYVVVDGPLFPDAEGAAFVSEHEEHFPAAAYERRRLREVLDEGDQSAAESRVRLVCQGLSARLGVWHRRADLQRTNRDAALMTPGPQIVDASASTAPGMRLRAGADLELGEEDEAGLVPVHYHDEQLDARGFLPAQSVDVVWNGRDEVDDETNAQTDMYLREGTVRFRTEPGGEVFATLTKHHWPEVKSLDRRNDFVLVALQHQSAVVVGWVEAKHVRGLPVPKRGLIGKGGRGGSGTGPAAMVYLEQGTMLLNESDGAPIGIVDALAPFECAEPCDQSAPLVWVHGCNHAIRLRADRASVAAPEG